MESAERKQVETDLPHCSAQVSDASGGEKSSKDGFGTL
jgi:hypothetical protein